MLALDSDPMPGLAGSLGIGDEDEPALLAAAERNPAGRWQLRKGVGPVRAVQRCARVAPDGVRLLQCGKLTSGGQAQIQGAINAFRELVHRVDAAPAFAGWTFIGDLAAGTRQTAFDWAPYARHFLLVAEPTWASALTARRVAAMARERGGEVLLVASKVHGAEDERRVAELVCEPVFAAVPADDAVREADRSGSALVDHAPDSEAARAIAVLVERLDRLSP